MNAMTAITPDDRLLTIAGKITQGIYAAPLDRATPRQRGLAMMIAGNISSALFTITEIAPPLCHGCSQPIDEVAQRNGLCVRHVHEGGANPICSNCAGEPA